MLVNLALRMPFPARRNAPKCRSRADPMRHSVRVPDIPKTEIHIWKSDAVVLFDWLMTVDLNTVPITHPAEKQALADLLSRLEETDVRDSTQEDIDHARAEVARDMGW